MSNEEMHKLAIKDEMDDLLLHNHPKKEKERKHTNQG
jgi:hypothetical protein